MQYSKKIIIVILLLCLAYGGYKISSSTKPVEKNSSPVSLTVSVVQPEVKSLQETYTINGTIIPKEDVIINTELVGVKITNVLFDVGQQVKKGQILARTDAANSINNLAELQADFNRTEDEFIRIERIKNTGAVSKDLVAQKNSAFQMAKARLNNAKLNTYRANIISPVNGTIYERKATIGALVNSNEALFKIAKDNEIEFEGKAPENLLGKLQNEMLVNVAIIGLTPDISGTVRLISPNVDGLNRTASIRVALPKDKFIPIGSFGKAQITVNKITAMTIPASALQNDANQNFVWLVDGEGNVVKQNVTLKLRTDENVAIEDISPESKIIAKAGSFVKEGDKVNIAK